jgi:hypothetical protein
MTSAIDTLFRHSSPTDHKTFSRILPNVLGPSRFGDQTLWVVEAASARSVVHAIAATFEPKRIIHSSASDLSNSLFTSVKQCGSSHLPNEYDLLCVEVNGSESTEQLAFLFSLLKEQSAKEVELNVAAPSLFQAGFYRTSLKASTKGTNCNTIRADCVIPSKIIVISTVAPDGWESGVVTIAPPFPNADRYDFAMQTWQHALFEEIKATKESLHNPVTKMHPLIAASIDFSLDGKTFGIRSKCRYEHLTQQEYDNLSQTDKDQWYAAFGGGKYSKYIGETVYQQKRGEIRLTMSTSGNTTSVHSSGVASVSIPLDAKHMRIRTQVEGKEIVEHFQLDWNASHILRGAHDSYIHKFAAAGSRYWDALEVSILQNQRSFMIEYLHAREDVDLSKFYREDPPAICC